MRWANVYIFFLTLALIFAQFGEDSWFFELFSHGMFQYFLLSTFLLLVVMFRKDNPRIKILLVLTAVSGYLLLTAVLQRAPTVKTARPSHQIRILEHNAQMKATTLTHWLPAHAASYDVVVILEAPMELAAVMQRLKGDFPYQVSHLENGPFGIAVLSRWEITHQEDFKAEAGIYPQYELTLRAPTGDEFLLYAMHTPPPLGPHMAESHEAIMGELTEKLQQKKHPAIVVGDLNMTQYAKRYAKLLRLTGLRDTAGLSPWQHTWPALTANLFSPLGIRIDHCLVSTTFALLERERLEDLHSDHLPVRCVVQIEK